MGNILGYSPVLAGEYIRPRDAFRPIARERQYLIDYKCGYVGYAKDPCWVDGPDNLAKKERTTSTSIQFKNEDRNFYRCKTL